jgi:hypothetical protein
MPGRAMSPTVSSMKGTSAILWTAHGPVHSGGLEVVGNRLVLSARGRQLSVPFASIVRFTIERGPAARLSGLAVLSLTLVDGDVVRVASLQGIGLLHDLAALLVPTAAAV